MGGRGRGRKQFNLDQSWRFNVRSPQTHEAASGSELRSHEGHGGNVQSKV